VNETLESGEAPAANLSQIAIIFVNWTRFFEQITSSLRPSAIKGKHPGAMLAIAFRGYMVESQTVNSPWFGQRHAATENGSHGDDLVRTISKATWLKQVTCCKHICCDTLISVAFEAFSGDVR